MGTGQQAGRFDEVPDRRDSDSVKWRDVDPDVIPAWVADMDFAPPRPVIDALVARARQGWLGYADAPARLTDAVVDHLERRLGWRVDPTHIVHLPGVVNAFSFACRFTPDGALAGQRAAPIVVVPPVYPPLLSAPGFAGRAAISAPLARSRRGARLHFELDLDAIERAFIAGGRQLLWCAPQNPTGILFTRRELEALAELCLRHGVQVCSDDIWAELALGHGGHVPLASISEDIAARTITLMAPSKAFNVPAMGSAFAIIADNATRGLWQTYEGRGFAVPNVLGFYGAIAAYEQCDAWLDELRAYLTANRDMVSAFVADHLPGAAVTHPDATYLSWLDLSPYAERFGELRADEYLLRHARVRLSPGIDFGGARHEVRLNFGCPRSTLREILGRLRSALL